MADPSEAKAQPTLERQTVELGKMLKAISDKDPSGTPTLLAAAAFAAWLREAGPNSRHPDRFADVQKHFQPSANANRDLHHLFAMLSPSVDAPEDDPPEPEAPRAFVNLPLASS